MYGYMLFGVCYGGSYAILVMMLKLKRELEKEKAFLREECLTIVAPSH